MPTALFSVWDKTGVIDLATRLSTAGWHIIASGGTAKVLSDGGLKVKLISEITGEPEMLGGRVKTLHPAIHAGLLARQTKADQSALSKRGWEPIDLVVVNLYPFEAVISQPNAKLEDAIEHIDIGGVTLLRAAAKNHTRVCALSDPADYPADINLISQEDYRIHMARKTFAYTSRYDSSIDTYFANLIGAEEPLNLRLYPVQTLRYGENPHQTATYLSPQTDGKPFDGQLLQGKQLSYNNLLDLDAAWRASLAFDESTVVIVKHNCPCGIASAQSLEQAVEPAIQSDPVSAFGSVIACNREVSRGLIENLGNLFVECIAAPGFSTEALELLTLRRNLRILQIPTANKNERHEIRSIYGGYLLQTIDRGDPPDSPEWRVVSQRRPTDVEMRKLRFAWKASQFVKSNAIVLTSANTQSQFTVGIGGGQPNRLDCVRIAGERAAERAKNSVLASDAFFPFPDGVDVAAKLGVTAIIQPGGSARDDKVIAAADEAGLAMVFTGVRHFRH